MQIHWSMYHNIPQKPTSLVTFQFPQWPVFKQLLNKTSLCAGISPSNIHRWQHHHDNRTRWHSTNLRKLVWTHRFFPSDTLLQMVSCWIDFITWIQIDHTHVLTVCRITLEGFHSFFFFFFHFLTFHTCVDAGWRECDTEGDSCCLPRTREGIPKSLHAQMKKPTVSWCKLK